MYPRGYDFVYAVLRRERKKSRQRDAAIRFWSGTHSSPRSSPASGLKFSSVPVEVQSRKVRIDSPVISPTTFMLDSFDPAKWVVVQRRRRKQKHGRRRCVWPPVRSDRILTQRMIACDSKKLNVGHLGSSNQRIDSRSGPYGRMGQDVITRKLQTGCIPQFARGCDSV
jgi:hypothetical protein